MIDCITIGGATRDIFLEIDEFKEIKKNSCSEIVIPYGRKYLSRETFYGFGGGAVNVAVCLSRLGLKVAANCRIGQEGTGGMVYKLLRAERVSARYVTRDPESHTGLSMFLLGKDSDHVAFLERGANNNYEFKGFGPGNPKWFFVSSLTGRAANSLDKIFTYAQKKKIKIAFNPGASQLELGLERLKKYFAQTELLCLNRDEAKQILKTGRTVEEMLGALGKLGPRYVLITDGGNGASIIVEGKVYKVKACPSKVVDTTGAGDSFCATFLFGLVKGFALPYCLKIAAVNSASVVSKMGAQAGLLKYARIKESKCL